MKSYQKIIVALFIAIFSLGAAQAQIRFGIKGGLNLNSLHFNDAATTFSDDNKCGYTVGVMTEFQVPIIGLCFDLSAMYTRMNSEVLSKAALPGNIDSSLANMSTTSYITNNSNHENIGKNFLEIPVNIKYKFGIPVISNILTPYLFTGPSFAFKLDKNKIDEMETRTSQVAWNIGLGVQLIRHLQISGSYGFGMNNVAKHWMNTESIKAKNNYWTVTAAWLF